MSYITDNSLPILLILAAVAVVALITGMPKGKSVAAVCVLAGLGLFVLEQNLVSPSEQVEIQIEEMLGNFRARDIDAIAGQISKNSPALIDEARRGLDLVDVTDRFTVKSVEVEFDTAGTKATAFVRANGVLTLRTQGGGSRNVPTYWRTIWVQNADTWKLSEVVELNPVNGQERRSYGGGG